MVRGPTRRYLAGKRALDLVACTLLLVIAIPVIAVCALAIRLETPGPVMIAQLRTGRDGQRFRILRTDRGFRIAGEVPAAASDRTGQGVHFTESSVRYLWLDRARQAERIDAVASQGRRHTGRAAGVVSGDLR